MQTDKPQSQPKISNTKPSNAIPVTEAFASDSHQQLLSQMQQTADTASQLLKSLSHPQRLLLLCQLTEGEQCVAQLEARVGLKQPSLSQQLGVLRKDGIVTTRREGKHIYYAIANDDALAVMQVLYERFCNNDC